MSSSDLTLSQDSLESVEAAANLTEAPEELPVTSEEPRPISTYVIGLVVVVCAVFGFSISFDFVNWDDPWYVLKNEWIRGWTPRNLWGIATETVARNYAPITIFSYLIDHTLWGDWAGGYHLTNVLLHAVNSVLVFLLVRQLTRQNQLAILTAFLFAVHPVQVESVVWISARKGLLSAAFILLSLYFWLKQERTTRDELWGLGFYLLALFSKAVGIIVPGIVFVYDWIVRKKTFAEAFSRQIIGLLIAIWFTLLTAGAQQTVGGGVRHHFSLSRLEMLGLDMVILWRYVGQLLWPAELSLLYDPPLRGISVWIGLATLAWGVLAVVLWRQRQRYPLVVFACVCWLAPLVPVLNLFPITTVMNDRYLYLPAIPFFAVILWGIEKLIRYFSRHWEHNPRRGLFDSERTQRREILGQIGLIAILACALRTTFHLPVWQNDLSLWTHTVQVSPRLPVVQYQYTLALWNSGAEEAAIERLQQVVEMDRVDQWDQSRFELKLKEFRSDWATEKAAQGDTDPTR